MERRGESRRKGKKGKKRSRQRNGSMRERIGVLGRAEDILTPSLSLMLGYPEALCRRARTSSQFFPEAALTKFKAMRRCVCGESVCG
jgi:hypothetical protein